MPTIPASDYTAYIKMKAANLAYSQPTQTFISNQIGSAIVPYNASTTVTYSVIPPFTALVGSRVNVTGMSLPSLNANGAIVTAATPSSFTTATAAPVAGTIALTSYSSDGTTVTFTKVGAGFSTLFTVGQIVTVAGADTAGFNGTFRVVSGSTANALACVGFSPTTTPTTLTTTLTSAILTYTNIVSGVTAYATAAITSGSSTGALATFNLTGGNFANWLTVGQVVTTSGFANTAFNGTFAVVTPGTNSFTATGTGSTTTPANGQTALTGTAAPGILKFFKSGAGFSTILQVGQTVSFGGSSSSTQDGVFTVTGLTADVITAAVGSITGISAGAPILTYTKYNYLSELAKVSYATPYTRIPVSNQTVAQPVPTISILNSRVFTSQMGLLVDPTSSSLSSTIASVRPYNGRGYVNHPQALSMVSTSGTGNLPLVPGSTARLFSPPPPGRPSVK